MEDFITKNILPILVTQLAIGVAAVVKLWFDFQTLKRDFENKAKEDKEATLRTGGALERALDKKEENEKKERVRAEKWLEKHFNKIEKKVDGLYKMLEENKEELHETDKRMSGQIMAIKAKMDIYAHILAPHLEGLAKNKENAG